MDQAVILSAVRTPVGKFQGGLAPLSAPSWAPKSWPKRCAARASSPSSRRNHHGQRVPAGLGQNPARQAALGGGLDLRVAAMTINKVCGSGLKAVALAAQGVMLGENEIVVAGGMEIDVQLPLFAARRAHWLPHRQRRTGGLDDSRRPVGRYNNFHMGMTAELVAEKYNITRQEQDQFALESHQRAVRAMKILLHRIADRAGRDSAEEGRAIVIGKRRIAARGTSLEALAKLRPHSKRTAR